MALDPRPLHACLESAVARGEPAGYVAVVRSGGERAVLAGGVADLDSGMPMRPDTVMRIASLTKPVGAVLTLQLVERGVLALDDAVGRWVPEQEITVRHLLTNTAGLGVGRESTPLPRR